MFKPEVLQQIISSWGGLAFLLLMAVVFSETGLLAGFFLPGDSLLFLAGMMVATERLLPPAFLPQTAVVGIITLNVLLMVAAFLGNSTGYWFGSKAGPPLFNRPHSRLFRKDRLEAARDFFEKHGGKAIIAAEFLPFFRTFVPVVAGVAGMPYRKFITYNVIGVVVWVFTMTNLGFWLGRNDWVRHNLEWATIGIVLLSIIPAAVHILKERRAAK
jgi:membrane-associated protein